MKKIKTKYTNPILALLFACFSLVWFFYVFFSGGHSGTIKKISGEILRDAFPETKKIANENEKKLFVPILMYHHIGELPENADSLRKNLTLSEAAFERQVAWLKQNGYESITLQNLLEATKGNFRTPKKPIILTFDDGYEDALINVPKILKKYGFVGSFAIITAFPGVNLNGNTYASWKQIREAKALGMEIVSHTQDHFDGTNKKYEENFILRNLIDSQKDIKNNLNAEPPKILVYPYGNYDTKYTLIAKQAGFKMGITTNPGKTIYFDKLMEVPRVRVVRTDSLEDFIKKVKE